MHVWKKSSDVNIHFCKPHIFWTFTFLYVATIFTSLYVYLVRKLCLYSCKSSNQYLVSWAQKQLGQGYEKMMFSLKKTGFKQKHLWSCPVLLSEMSVLFCFFTTNMDGNCPEVFLIHPAVTHLQMLKHRHELQLLAWQPSYITPPHWMWMRHGTSCRNVNMVDSLWHAQMWSYQWFSRNINHQHFILPTGLYI